LCVNDIDIKFEFGLLCVCVRVCAYVCVCICAHGGIAWWDEINQKVSLRQISSLFYEIPFEQIGDDNEIKVSASTGDIDSQFDV